MASLQRKRAAKRRGHR